MIGEDGILALADGTSYRGRIFGADKSDKSGRDGASVGEVVFNTSMTGYQEIVTDPSYAGQILTFTYPHIGNVGCNEADWESDKIHVRGVIVRELSKVASNFRSQKDFSTYLKESRISGISGIETRALVSHLRDNGSQMGAYGPARLFSRDDLVDLARSEGSMEGKDYVREVSCKAAYTWDELPWSLAHPRGRRLKQEELVGRPHLVAIDCGIKRNILRLLLETGFRVTVVPAYSTAAEIMALKPDGLFLSNGPGDPATLDYVVNPVKELLGKLPIFGICLGHQILSQALGGKTYKLKFGHRGGNHPVMDYTTNKVEITVQNHGFAVSRESLSEAGNGTDVQITHLNLNDNTIEGVASNKLRCFAVQYHPEAAPGPHDSQYLFKRFFDLVTHA